MLVWIAIEIMTCVVAHSLRKMAKDLNKMTEMVDLLSPSSAGRISSQV